MIDKETGVLLADAHTCSRIGQYQVLADAGFPIIAEAAGLEDLETLLQTHRPHLLLLAGNLLPDRPRRFLARLRQRYPSLPIVLYLADADNLPAGELVDAGVSVVLKPEPTPALVQVVRAAAAGHSAFSPAVLAKLQEPLEAGAQEALLKDRERQLLRLVCEEKSNAEIATALYMSQKSVERRLTALFRKLSVQTRVGAAVWFTQYENKKSRSAEW